MQKKNDTTITKPPIFSNKTQCIHQKLKATDVLNFTKTAKYYNTPKNQITLENQGQNTYAK